MRRLLAAGPLGFLLLVLAAGTVLGAAGNLSNPVVTPLTAPAGTAINFQVTYTSAQGRAPKAVTVVLNHSPYAMTGTGTDWTAGVVFKATVKPAAGTYEVVFVSVESHSYSQSQLPGGTLTITAAPTPTPPPTVAPTPTPAPPTVAPTPTPAPPTVQPTPKPTVQPTPKPTVAATPRPTTAPTPKPTRAPTPKPAATPVPATPATASNGTTPSPVPTVPGSSTVDGTSAQGGAGSGATPGHSPDAQAQPVVAANHEDMAGPPSGGPLAHGVGTPETQARYYDLFRYPTMTSYELAKALLPTVVTLMTCATAWAAFMLFGGKKRRDADIEMFEDPRLAAAASTVYEAPAASGLRQVDEAMMPRWRRPSLQQMRRTDPNRGEIQETTLSFDGLVGTRMAGYERRRIGYRLVRLMDSPDEFRAQEIGLLDHGDEVMLLERYGVYWRVLCPDGREGWIHRMTLADPTPAGGYGPTAYRPSDDEPMPQYGFEDDEPAPALVEAAPEVEEPVYDEPVPTNNYDGAGDGLLEAYMEARRQALRSLEHETTESAATPPSDASGEPHAA